MNIVTSDEKFQIKTTVDEWNIRLPRNFSSGSEQIIIGDSNNQVSYDAGQFITVVESVDRECNNFFSRNGISVLPDPYDPKMPLNELETTMFTVFDWEDSIVGQGALKLNLAVAEDDPYSCWQTVCNTAQGNTVKMLMPPRIINPNKVNKERADLMSALTGLVFYTIRLNFSYGSKEKAFEKIKFSDSCI